MATMVYNEDSYYEKTHPPEQTKIEKVSIMKRIVRNIMLLCTLLCTAKVLILLHPFVMMLPISFNEVGDKNAVLSWVVVVAISVVAYIVALCVSMAWASFLSWIFGD